MSLKALMQGVGARFAGDGELTGLVETIGSEPAITQWRSFQNPSEIRAPRVVYRLDGGPDEPGLHGARQNPTLDITVWGYGPAMLGDCQLAAQRIDELLLEPVDPGDGGGGTPFRSITGWQSPDDSDPQTVRLLNRYVAAYWNKGRVDAIAAS